MCEPVFVTHVLHECAALAKGCISVRLMFVSLILSALDACACAHVPAHLLSTPSLSRPPQKQLADFMREWKALPPARM